MSDIPKEFSQEYYDGKYFADLEGKSFLTPGEKGWKIEHWGYRNPEGEFLGAKLIAKAWKAIFKPKTMLDIGAGRGTFIAYARDEGIEADGFDYSEWAVNHPYPRCKREWLRQWDATKIWPTPDRSWDLVTALDFLEHIYEDLPLLSCDYRNLIYLKCYVCSERRNGLCPIKLAVSENIGENFKEKEEKALFIEQNKMHVPKLGVKEINYSLNGKKELKKAVNVHMRNLKETQKDGKYEENKTPRECVNGEKTIKSYPNSEVERYIKEIRNTSKAIQKNVTTFWQNVEQVIKDIVKDTMLKEKMDFLNLKEINAKFVETRMNELLKSITSMEKKNGDTLGYMTKIGVNCNFCVPTVIRLCTSDVDFVISELFRVSRKWIFLQTAITRQGVAAPSFSTTSQNVSGYKLKKGEPVPKELQGIAVAGHVNVQPEEYWLNKLDDDRFLLRRDMAAAFTALVPNEIIANWLKNSIIVLERV